MRQSPALLEIANWLSEHGTAGGSATDLLDGYCRRLREVGLPLDRAYLGSSTLHPKVRALGVVWRSDGGIQVPWRSEGGITEVSDFRHADSDDAWRRSPFYAMIMADISERRERLNPARNAPGNEMLGDFARQGYSDWVARIFRFGNHTLGSNVPFGLVTSWMTRQGGGFDDEQIAMLNHTLPAMACAAKNIVLTDIADNLMSTYLGKDAAQHVLAGEIRRGEVRQLNAALFFADLRGFTALADAQSTERTVAILNDYLDCIGQAVADNGGEILKFLGDGLLATFALEAGDETATCARALAAAEQAQQAIAAHNAAKVDRSQALTLDIALHLGDVLYGNVGTQDRLDFTVVGPAVNEAQRIEALCHELGHAVLTSQAFHAACGPAQARLKSLGRQTLRGVREAGEIFALIA